MKKKQQTILFLCGVACTALAMGINESIFNNFLSDTFDLSADVRGRLEFPRELPGLLVVLMTGILASLSVARLGVVGAAITAVGLACIGLFGTHWYPMVLTMMVASAGMHLLQPVRATIAIALGDENNCGKRLGFMGAIATCGTILGTGAIWLFFDRDEPQYQTAFLCAACVAAVGALFYKSLHIPHLHQPRARLVIRKKYSLYYVLELLFGARKQIFLTFGPWVLIRIYEQSPHNIALLLMIAAFVGIVFKPFAGWMIDRIGERAVMVTDGICLAVVCMGYGYAMQLTGEKDNARLIASGCFILDNLLFSLGTARAVYVSRLTSTHQELTSTLSMGISINHAVSMTIPAVGGALWIAFGYEHVFLAAAVLALSISVVSCRVPPEARISHNLRDEIA